MLASVIIVSHHRPRDLAQCLKALVGQTHPDFEVILVADAASLGVLPDLPIKRVAFERRNISQARNAGLALAAGEVVLFIDDDALAAPRWVELLAEPFGDPRVVAATGFTRGPDGLNWQVRAERIDASGRCQPIEVDGPCLLAVEDGQPVSTIGTNCAFRRAALIEIGGFDPAFAYHLDESDVNMRMAARYPLGLTAVIPRAEVVHGLAPGVSRDAARVPSDLRAIGRSSTLFAARHGGNLDGYHAAHRAALLRHMVAGRLDPFAVARLMSGLERGMAEAGGRAPAAPVWTAGESAAFRRFPARPAEPAFLSGWFWQRRSLRQRAAKAVAQGAAVTLLLLTPTFLPHRKILHPAGWWEQHGGIWGASTPDDPFMILMRPAARARREYAFFAALRH